MEANFIRQHRKHRVRADEHNWLVCMTCGIPIKIVTQSAAEALREIDGQKHQ